MVEVVQTHFEPRALIAVPAIEAAHGGKGSEHIVLVELPHVGVVDGLDAEAPLLDGLREEVTIHPVAQFKPQFVGQCARHHNALVRGGVAQLRQTSLHHVVTQKGEVGIGAQPLEHDAGKVVGSLEDAHFLCETLHMGHMRLAAHLAQQG